MKLNSLRVVMPITGRSLDNLLFKKLFPNKYRLGKVFYFLFSSEISINNYNIHFNNYVI